MNRARSRFVFAAGALLWACGGTHDAAFPAAPTASATATPAPRAPHSEPWVADEPIVGLQDRADGHLLGWSKRTLYDWDLNDATLRRIDLGEHQAERSPFVSAQAPVFVVVRALDDGDARRIEVWDARTLSLRSSRDVTGEVDHAAFSNDGARLGTVVCLRVEDGSWEATCHVRVQATADDGVVGEARLDGLSRAYVPFHLVLSPSGHAFGLSHEGVGVRAYASATGRPIVVLAAPGVRLNHGEDRLIFLTDHRVLTAAPGAWLRISDETGVSRDRKIPMGTNDTTWDHLLAPDGKRLAVLLGRDDRRRIVVWSFADGSVKSLPLPYDRSLGWKSVRRYPNGSVEGLSQAPEGGRFRDYTSIRWDDATHLVALSGSTPQDQRRIDVVTGEQRAEPFAEVAAFERDGYRVFGDFQMRGVDVLSARTMAPAVETRVILPSGQQIPLPELIPNRSQLTTVAGALVVGLDGGVIVFDARGTRRRLAPAR